MYKRFTICGWNSKVTFQKGVTPEANKHFITFTKNNVFTEWQRFDLFVYIQGYALLKIVSWIYSNCSYARVESNQNIQPNPRRWFREAHPSRLVWRLLWSVIESDFHSESIEIDRDDRQLLWGSKIDWCLLCCCCLHCNLRQNAHCDVTRCFHLHVKTVVQQSGGVPNLKKYVDLPEPDALAPIQAGRNVVVVCSENKVGGERKI